MPPAKIESWLSQYNWLICDYQDNGTSRHHGRHPRAWKEPIVFTTAQQHSDPVSTGPGRASQKCGGNLNDTSQSHSQKPAESSCWSHCSCSRKKVDSQISTKHPSQRHPAVQHHKWGSFLENKHENSAWHQTFFFRFKWSHLIQAKQVRELEVRSWEAEAMRAVITNSILSGPVISRSVVRQWLQWLNLHHLQDDCPQKMHMWILCPLHASLQHWWDKHTRALGRTDNKTQSWDSSSSSVVKSTCWSCRGLEFDSQQFISSNPPVTPVLGDPIPSYSLRGYLHTHARKYTYTWVK